MEINWNIFFIIAGAAIVTFIPRVLPLMVLSRKKLPQWVERWLNYVPVSVMTALIAQSLFVHDGKLSVFSINAELPAAVSAFFIAIRTRNLLATVVGGIAGMMLFRLWL